MPESTGLAECGATPAWRVSANDIAATGSPHEFVRTLHVQLQPASNRMMLRHPKHGEALRPDDGGSIPALNRG